VCLARRSRWELSQLVRLHLSQRVRQAQVAQVTTVCAFVVVVEDLLQTLRDRPVPSAGRGCATSIDRVHRHHISKSWVRSADMKIEAESPHVTNSAETFVVINSGLHFV
jgi:hypothetical protein